MSKSSKGKKISAGVDSGEAGRLLGRPTGSADELVLATAKSMAHELYDEMMKKNDWYALWKSWHEPSTTAKDLELSFVRLNTPGLLAAARTVLAQMLRTTTDEALRDSIADALLRDATLARPGMRGIMQ